ncbi:hypothetical protein GAS19_20555 [Burkholderia glumae]|uniref:hypothetical protein n=1 Tax=Burkholderia glumae TaxID=337 RepID=UPI001297CEF6|nr:hypothetical protein GAS19_20555 [Burkholderia glumae]
MLPTEPLITKRPAPPYCTRAPGTPSESSMLRATSGATSYWRATCVIARRFSSWRTAVSSAELPSMPVTTTVSPTACAFRPSMWAAASASVTRRA